MTLIMQFMIKFKYTSLEPSSRYKYETTKIICNDYSTGNEWILVFYVLRLSLTTLFLYFFDFLKIWSLLIPWMSVFYSLSFDTTNLRKTFLVVFLEYTSHKINKKKGKQQKDQMHFMERHTLLRISSCQAWLVFSSV